MPGRFDSLNGSPPIRDGPAAVLERAGLRRAAATAVAVLGTMVFAAPAGAQGTSSDPVLPEDNGVYPLGTFFTGPECPQLATSYEPFPTPLTVEQTVDYEVTGPDCRPVALPIFGRGMEPEFHNPDFPRQEWEMNVSNFGFEPVGPYQPGKRVYATFYVFDPCQYKVKKPGRNAKVKIKRAGQDKFRPLRGSTTIRDGDSIFVESGSATLVRGDGSEIKVGGLFTVDRKLDCKPGPPGEPPRPPTRPPSGTLKEGDLGVKLRGISDFVTKTGETINRALTGADRQHVPRTSADRTHIGGGVPSPHGVDVPVTNSFRVIRSGREHTTKTCAFKGRLSVTSRNPRRSVTVRPGRCAIVTRGRPPRVVPRGAAGIN